MGMKNFCSAVDFGCRGGSWLSVFRDLGVETVYGIDGDWVDVSQLRIPVECFHAVALDGPLSLPSRFDLAICLEVAEHLPPERVMSFIGELCAAAPVVLFSAAIPHQGGVNHVNKQWPD